MLAGVSVLSTASSALTLSAADSPSIADREQNGLAVGYAVGFQNTFQLGGGVNLEDVEKVAVVQVVVRHGFSLKKAPEVWGKDCQPSPRPAAVSVAKGYHHPWWVPVSDLVRPVFSQACRYCALHRACPFGIP